MLPPRSRECADAHLSAVIAWRLTVAAANVLHPSQKIAIPNYAEYAKNSAPIMQKKTDLLKMQTNATDAMFCFMINLIKALVRIVGVKLALKMA